MNFENLDESEITAMLSGAVTHRNIHCNFVQKYARLLDDQEQFKELLPTRSVDDPEISILYHMIEAYFWQTVAEDAARTLHTKTYANLPEEVPFKELAQDITHMFLLA